MRKLFLMAILSLVSSFAFSQEVQTPEAPTAAASAPAPVSTVESAAGSFGNWLGRMVKAPVVAAKALASGVKAGFNETPAATPPASPTASEEVPASKEMPVGLQERVAQLVAQARAKLIAQQAPAPVEDRTATIVTAAQTE